MEVFIMKPSVNLYPGVRVTKDTVLEYKNDKVEQKVENLILHSIIHATGENFESVYDTKIQLNEGDILIYEDEGRGYIKPVEQLCTIEEAIVDLESIKGVGE
jgi:sporulation protein YlmC with PRC-barrel domain